MLLDCPALFAQRQQYFGDLRSLIVNCVGIKQWESTFNTKEKNSKTDPRLFKLCMSKSEKGVCINCEVNY